MGQKAESRANKAESLSKKEKSRAGKEETIRKMAKITYLRLEGSCFEHSSSPQSHQLIGTPEDQI
jgi:hypothetical protein